MTMENDSLNEKPERAPPVVEGYNFAELEEKSGEILSISAPQSLPPAVYILYVLCMLHIGAEELTRLALGLH